VLDAARGAIVTSDRKDSAISLDTRRGELCAAAALVFVGLFFVWQSAALKFGSIEQPGPGFFPLILGLALSALALAIGFDRLRQPPDGGTIALGHRDVLIAFAALVVLPILFERLGAYPTLGLFMAALLVLIGRASPIIAVSAAGAAMVAVWAFFNVLLGVRLPLGIF
jgi:putative tricarboxylic transport membrane protein